ncbi:zinc finger protein 638 isoform X2 [Rhincodon typus]|uniref:zinc finger protein 638 isoform X2 n=1 Tax=Rhincodon typus TaxID=259920 RepID=UPI00202FF0EE|nr:zinc finger protein 638 isoform X2 [Rhincodon typus]
MSPKRLSPRRMSPPRSSPRRLSPRRGSPRHPSPRRPSPRRSSPHRSRSSPRRTSPRRSSPHRSRPSPKRSSPHRSRPRRLSPHKSKPSPKHLSPHRPSPRKPSPKRKLQKELPAKNSKLKPATGQLADQKPANQKVKKRLPPPKKPGTEDKTTTGGAAAVKVEKPTPQHDANAQLMQEMKRSGRVVHITDLPHDGYTEEDITKLTQPFGKVAAIKLVRTKNEAFLEMAYKEAAVALVEFYSITPVEINHRQVTMVLLGRKKEMHKQPDQKEQLQSQVFPPVQKEISAPVTSGSAQCASETNPPSVDAKTAESEDTALEKGESENVGLNVNGRVIRINNLPARGYKEDDLKRLAKPFGQVLNVVITFSRNQAYLEMACAKAAAKMVEFYSLSTIKLKGNAISMQVLHQYVDLSDMELIFKDMIEESGFKPDAGCTIYDHLVHISNLPEDGYTEVDILCVAFRFGRVKDSMFLKPHNKVLLQLESGNAATSMCNFFREIPHDFHGKTLEFSLSPKAGTQLLLDFTSDSPAGFRFDSPPAPQLRLNDPQGNPLQGPSSQQNIETSSGNGAQSASKEPNPWWGRSGQSIQFMPLPHAKPIPQTMSTVSEKSTFETILSGTRAKWSSDLLHWAGGPLKGSLDDKNCWKAMTYRETPLECHILLPLAFRLPLSLEHQNRLRFNVGIPNIPAVAAPEVDQPMFQLLVSKGVVSTKQELDNLLGVIEATRSIQSRVTETVSPLILAAQKFELDKLKGDFESLSRDQLKERLLSAITACRLAVVLAGQTHTFLSELRSDRLLRATGMEKIAPSPLDFPNLSTADLLGPHFLDVLTCRLLAAKQKQHDPAAAKELNSFMTISQKRKAPPRGAWPRFAARGKPPPSPLQAKVLKS